MRRAYIPVAAMLLFMLAPTAHAVATSFCVGTSAELQAALDQSATDGVDDVIKIRSGTYAPTTGSIAFAYFNSSDDTSLTISGGWSNLGMFNCIAQFGAPTATVLSGANARRVMRLQGDAGTSGALSVSNLTIRSGNASTDGGGLTLGDVAGFTGNLRVEQVYFDSNFATTFAAGALIATGGTIIVRNNWFRANECDSNYCAGEFVANFADKVDVRNSIGNNTIVANACGPGAPVTCVNSGFIVSGSARAAVFNNAFAFNAGDDLRLTATTDLLNNNINQLNGTPAFSSGNLNLSNPQFVDPFADDYHLLFDSPLRNGGTAGYATGALDFDGNPRLNDFQYDIGAFENNDALFRDGFEVVL